MDDKNDFIPFALPSISKLEENAVLEVLRSNWLTTGQVTNKFEKEFADFLDVKYALALNSATAGLHLSLEAIGVKAGTKVITSPFTFTAVAEVIRYLGAHPLFVDIEENTFNIDANAIEANIRNNIISAIIPVHICGYLCDMYKIKNISEQYNIPIIEDAAHAFPCKTQNGYAGTLGHAGVFSFYVTKPITTGEGGMVVTNSEKIAKRISIMRLHGIDREVWNRYQAKGTTSWEYNIIDAGFKYNLTDIASALGRVQLKRANSFLKKRRNIANNYLEAFKSVDFLILPETSEAHSWHLFIVMIKPEKLKITRNEFVQKLMHSGIGTSVHFKPLHLMPYYKRLYNFKPEDFPNALKKYETCFSLPIYPDLTLEQQSKIIKTVIEIGKMNYKK